MFLSRTLVLAIAAVPMPAQAAGVLTADEALAHYRAMTTVVTVARCAAAADREEIVVCANRLRESQKVPYVAELRIGDRRHPIAGEPPSAAAVFSGPPCPPRGCPGGGSIIGFIGKVIDHARD